MNSAAPRLSQLQRGIAGRAAIVTGAASGMGRAVARLLADEGARVAAVDLNEAGVQLCAREIRAAHGEAAALAFACDAACAKAAATVAAEVQREFGRLDILVNNAGVSLPAALSAANYEQQWARTLEVNLSAQMRWVRACLPLLRESDAARIVNIASTEGLGASAGASAYTASKHGVVGLTRALALELGREGITVNCICPGPIHTGMTAAIPEEAKRKFARRRVPLRRYGAPEEVAHGVLNFVLPASGYMTGAVLPVDGGLLAQNT